MFIFKICGDLEWENALISGIYPGSDDDLRDGFIHFSTAGQLEGTASKHFAGREDLLLICYLTDHLQDSLRWEASRGGALFPHLYGPLPLAAVRRSWDLPLGEDGRHVFPPALADS